MHRTVISSTGLAPCVLLPYAFGDLPAQASALPRVPSAGRQQPAGGATTGKKPCRGWLPLTQIVEQAQGKVRGATAVAAHLGCRVSSKQSEDATRGVAHSSRRADSKRDEGATSHEPALPRTGFPYKARSFEENNS